MPSIFDRAVETSFKPTEGGYEFRCATPWLLGSWRRYLVNEAQKASLAAYLRQRQRFLLRLMVVGVLVAAGLTVWFQASSAPDPSTAGLFIILTLAAMLAVALARHLYLMREIEPLLAELTRLDEHVTLHQQIVGVAAVIKPVPLMLGGVGGALIAASNIKSIWLAVSEGSVGLDIVWSLLGLLAGVVLTSYFAYLVILKRRLGRRS
ncbi:MAG TPA: hypothetical protein VIY51_24930 [Xanthobacteraceae bacterium]